MNQVRKVLYYSSCGFLAACALSDSFAESVNKKFVRHIQNKVRILGTHDRFLTQEDIFGNNKQNKKQLNLKQDLFSGTFRYENILKITNFNQIIKFILSKIQYLPF